MKYKSTMRAKKDKTKQRQKRKIMKKVKERKND